MKRNTLCMRNAVYFDMVFISGILIVNYKKIYFRDIYVFYESIVWLTQQGRYKLTKL